MLKRASLAMTAAAGLSLWSALGGVPRAWAAEPAAPPVPAPAAAAPVVEAPPAPAIAPAFPALGAPLSAEAVAGWAELLGKGTLAAAQNRFEAALKDKTPKEAAAVVGLAYTHLIAGRRQAAAQILTDGLTKIGSGDGELASLYLDLLLQTITDLDQPDTIVQALLRCADAEPATASGEVRARARQMAVNLLLIQGKFKPAQELAAKQQFLTNWALIGPFENQDKKGQSEVYAPEKGIHFAEEAAGKNRPVKWRRVPGEALPLGKLHGEDLVFPNEHVVLYAATAIKVPQGGTYFLRLGCGGGARVFLNGALAGEVPYYSSYDFAKAEVPLDLVPGNNVVMVKLGIGEAMNRGFEFTAQLCNDQGMAIAIENSSDSALLETPGAPPAAVGKPKALASLLAQVDLALAQLEKPAEPATSAAAKPEFKASLLALKAALTANRNVGNPEDAKYEDILDHASKLAPDSLWINFLSAQLSRKRNLSILAAERVLARDAAAAGATQEILDRKGDAGLLQMAEQTARKMIESHQGDIGLWQVVVADAMQQRGDGAQARQVLAQAVEFRPLDSGLWIKHWGSLDTESEKSAEAQRALHYLGGNPRVLGAIARWKADNFHADEAAQLIQNALTIHPQNQDLLRMAVDFNVRDGKPERALALVEESLKIAAGHPELLQLKGELLRRLHPADDKVKKEVIALFEDSLASRPENPRLREYIELLRGKTEDWFKPYDHTPEAVKALIVPVEKFGDYPNDNLVILLDQQVIRVNENGTSETMVHQVQQVLRPQAIRQVSRNGVAFNSSRESVKVLRATVYDAKGNEIGRGEVHDGGQRGGTGQAQGRIYDDGYTQTLVNFTKLEVGSVIDFQYLRKDTKEGLYGNYYADQFYLGSDDPTRITQYILDLPKSRTFNMKSVRIDLPPVELEAPAPDRRVVKFERKDVPGLPHETNMPPTQDRLPFVQVSTFTDWNEVGKWYWQLSKEQLTPDNEKLKARVAEVIKDAKTDTDKLRAINDAVIKDIHYVGIELGRNGYKPHRADQTLASKMGDCKDCATLITSMCNLAGVPAKLVLIRTIEAGVNPKDALPAPNLFNHCIAYVPDCDGKAYWLDGTTNTNGLGEVPPSDQGANVLLISEEGGQWATIPRDSGDRNMWKTTIDVTVNADGSGQGHVRIDYTGFWQQWNRAVQEQADLIKRNMEGLIGRVFPKATLSDLKVGDPKDFNGPVFFEFSFKAPQVGSRINENEIGIVVEPFPWRWSQRYANEPERKEDLWVHFQYTIASTMVLHLPEGATVKTKPEDVELKDEHAVYTRKLAQDGTTITLTKSGTVLQETVKAAEYPAFKKWANRVDELENDSLTIQMK